MERDDGQTIRRNTKDAAEERKRLRLDDVKTMASSLELVSA